MPEDDREWCQDMICALEVPNVSVRRWGLPLQAEFVKFGAKVHEGGDWQQPFERLK